MRLHDPVFGAIMNVGEAARRINDSGRGRFYGEPYRLITRLWDQRAQDRM